jgi:hypothetical protein
VNLQKAGIAGQKSAWPRETTTRTYVEAVEEARRRLEEGDMSIVGRDRIPAWELTYTAPDVAAEAAKFTLPAHRWAAAVRPDEESLRVHMAVEKLLRAAGCTDGVAEARIFLNEARRLRGGAGCRLACLTGAYTGARGSSEVLFPCKSPSRLAVS